MRYPCEPLVPIKTQKFGCCHFWNSLLSETYYWSHDGWFLAEYHTICFCWRELESVSCCPLVNIIQHRLDICFSFTYSISTARNLKIVNKREVFMLLGITAASELTFTAKRVTLSIDPWGTPDSCFHYISILEIFSPSRTVQSSEAFFHGVRKCIGPSE